MLQRLRNFTIRCDLNGSLIQCQVNSSFAPALPGRTTCEVNNNNTPETCEMYMYTTAIACLIRVHTKKSCALPVILMWICSLVY